LPFFIQKFGNLWNFADVRVSAIAFGALFAASTFIALQLLIVKVRQRFSSRSYCYLLINHYFQFRFCLFFWTAIALIAVSSRETIAEAARAVAEPTTEAATPLQSNAAIRLTHLKHDIASALAALGNFISRIPDDSDLNHRY
jgi:hypothetical protein